MKGNKSEKAKLFSDWKFCACLSYDKHFGIAEIGAKLPLSIRKELSQ